MRFAISLLVLISIAAIIGTVLKQNEPVGNYVNQFGPFWYEVFAKLSLYNVYSAWWFLLILAFLVMSTSLCIVRNAPKMLKDMRSWREKVREESLRNFHHHTAWSNARTPAQTAHNLQQLMQSQGYQAKLVEKGDALLLVAKRGAGNKFGYIFAHSAIVIICLGGLLDSDLLIRAQQWLYDKQAFTGGGVIAQIPQQHRLSVNNPSFRGNTMISEGASSNTAVIPQANGVLIQDLPFVIELKKFTIDFYSTGMPKLFASEVVIHDPEGNKKIPATIKVNEPLIYKGIAIYQSSFEDGGSKLKLQAYAMNGVENHTFALEGEVGSATGLAAGDSKNSEYTIEWTGFRPFNVENMGNDLRAVEKGKSFQEKLAHGLDKTTGSAGKNANNKNLKNLGPSLQYKVRDKTGQAREYQNYMQPVQIDGALMYLSGMRESPNDPFSYLRIPADSEAGVKDWMRLRAALQNPQLRQVAAIRYGQRAIQDGEKSPADTEKLRAQLQESAAKSLSIFAGDGGKNGKSAAGFVAISDFIQRLPAAEQQKAADIFMKILQGCMWDLWQAAREKDGLPPVVADEQNGRFLQLATNAISDSFFYGAPVYLQLQDFTQIKASVLQVTRAPGKKIVYLGCLLLVLGVFAMFYIRERRVWVWLKEGGEGTQALLAMHTQRKTFDFEQEFTRLCAQVKQLA